MSTTSGMTILENQDGLLFEIVRSFCFQLNALEEKGKEDVPDLTIRTLSLLLPLMKEHPEEVDRPINVMYDINVTKMFSQITKVCSSLLNYDAGFKYTNLFVSMRKLFSACKEFFCVLLTLFIFCNNFWHISISLLVFFE
mgnify:CR=1 FL=1